MGIDRTRSCVESDNRDIPSVPPGFVSLTSFTLKKAGNSEEVRGSLASGSESEQRADQIAASTIIPAVKIKSSVRNRPWIRENHADLMEEESGYGADKSLFPRACLPKGVIRGCSSCHNCQKVTARWRPEEACIPSLKEAPVFHPTEEEFVDTLKYVASILPHVEPYGICRIVPPTSWQPPCLIKDKTMWETSGFDTEIQQINDLQGLFLEKRLHGAHQKMKNKRRKVLNRSLDVGSPDGQTVKLEEFGCSAESFEFESGPSFTPKLFNSHADYFKRHYFSKEDQVAESSFSSNVPYVPPEPSILDIEGEYWRMVEHPTEEIEVLHANSVGRTCSGFPLKSNSLDVNDYPQYVDSGWNLNNTPKLGDSLLRFESCDSSSVLLPRLSMGMCFSSKFWRIEEHHLYFLSYIHFGAPKILYGVPGRYRCKFEEAVKNHLPQLSQHPWLLHHLVSQFSPSALTSKGVPVYRCVQNPKEFVLILPGAYHAEFNSGFNCSEAVNFAPFDWLPHGQNSVEQYSEQGRKTSISHDKLLLGAAREAVRALWELSLQKNSFDNLKWRVVCGNDGILTKALKSRVESEVKRRKYLCAFLESRKMEDDLGTTVKRECLVCFYDLHLSAIGCNCSPDKYACFLHAKQLCPCGWSARYLLFRYEINELNILVDALEGKSNAVYKWAKEKLGLAGHCNVSKVSIKDGDEVPSTEAVTADAKKPESISQHGNGIKRKPESQEIQCIRQKKKGVSFTSMVGSSTLPNNLDGTPGSSVGAGTSYHLLQSKEKARDGNEVIFPKVSSHVALGENMVVASSNSNPFKVAPQNLAQKPPSSDKNVIILSDDEN